MSEGGNLLPLLLMYIKKDGRTARPLKLVN
jgi:hypothetical protein